MPQKAYFSKQWFIRHVVIALLVMIALGAAGGLHAAPDPTPIPTRAPVGPIGVADILTRVEDDHQRVEAAERLLAAPDPTHILQKQLDDIALPVDAKRDLLDRTALSDLPAMRLESLARHWSFDARRFQGWDMQARRAFMPYAETALQLAQRRAAWAATREEGIKYGVTPALINRVDVILAQFDAAQRALDIVLTRQFELSQRADQVKARIQTGESEVAAILGDMDRGLLRTDVAPLWRGVSLDASPGVDRRATFDTLKRGFEIERQFALDYHAAGTSNQQALRLIQGVLLLVILWLAVRGRRDPTLSGALPQVMLALRRPISAWLLLSMLAVLILEPDAPLLVQELALLIALVPLLRLLPAGKFNELGAWSYVAIVLYALDRLSVLALGDGELYRLFLFALNALALGLTIVFLRRRAPTHPAPTVGRPWLLRPVSWIALALLSAAAVSNIAGNLTLSETLTSGVIDSGYMGLILYASVAVCASLFRAFLRQPELSRRHFVRDQEQTLHVALMRILIAGASVGWMLYSMERFRILRPVYQASLSVMNVGIEVGEFALHIGDILIFVLSVWIAYWIARMVRRLLRDELQHHTKLPRGAGHSIASLSYYAVLMFGLFVALSAAGVKLGQLALLFGALGVGIGFGLQNLVSSFISGLVLMFERPVQPGDMVEASDTFGTVREIGLRSTIIRTFDGADVIVPNSLLISSNLTNWTMFDRTRRIELTIQVPVDADSAQVLGVLATAARATPGVADSPAPVVLLNGYDESALHFIVRAWTQDVSIFASVKGDLLAHLLQALQSVGITVPHKQVDVHVHSARGAIETL